MLKIKKEFFLLSLGGLLAAAEASGMSAQPVDIEAGQNLFAEYCVSCHGEKGVGQDSTRRGGGRDSNRVLIAPALNGTAHTWHHSPSYLFKYIKKGSVADDSPMPSFGKELNKHEILSIVAYFQSLWPSTIRKIYFEKYK